MLYTHMINKVDTNTTTNQANIKTNTPIVLLHGIASDVENTQELADWLSSTFNRPVFNIELGNGIDTSLTPMNLQLELLCKIIYEIRY